MKRKKKKKYKWWVLPVFIFVVLCIYIAAMYWWQHQQEDKAKFTMYSGFGIQLPEGYIINGIDVSYYQETVYWPSVK